MLSPFDPLKALRRDRHSSMEARTSSRRLRRATPQVETLDEIISPSPATFISPSPTAGSGVLPVSDPAETRVYNVGGFELQPGQVGHYFWDVPADVGLYRLGTWTVTAVPATSDIIEHEPAYPEQRVEVTDLVLLRKGPDSTAPNQLQLDYTIRNVGSNPARGTVVISAVLIS